MCAHEWFMTQEQKHNKHSGWVEIDKCWQRHTLCCQLSLFYIYYVNTIYFTSSRYKWYSTIVRSCSKFVLFLLYFKYTVCVDIYWIKLN